jgi:thermostable 8-oxoguanine DNA glycosylase
MLPYSQSGDKHMQTFFNSRNIQSSINKTDSEILNRIVRFFGEYVRVEPIGRYRKMTPEAVWLQLVGQVCVMGSARHWERLHSDQATSMRFKAAISPSLLHRKRNPASHLARILSDFSATRFPNKSAKRLESVLHSSSIFRCDDLILFDGLSHNADATQTRDALISRCPIFRLKSASDFMITVGLSHDVIALDTRIIGVLQKWFGYNLPPTRIQSHRGIYLSLEAELRDFCQEHNISLALLDRLLFRFSNIGAIELVVKYPELTARYA